MLPIYAVKANSNPDDILYCPLELFDQVFYYYKKLIAHEKSSTAAFGYFPFH